MNPLTAEQKQPFKSSSQEKSSPDESALLILLEQQQHCLDQVVQLLKTENRAITQRETETIGRLLDKKLPLLGKLDQLDKQRQLYFEQQTSSHYNHQKFTVFIDQHPAKKIYKLWHEIKDQLLECKKQNELNGRIISIQKNNTEQILQLLTGQTANNTQTYSNLGQTYQQKKSALYTSV